MKDSEGPRCYKKFDRGAAPAIRTNERFAFDTQSMTQQTYADILEAGGGLVVIDAYGSRGEGCVEFADGTIAVPGALPGERVEIALEPPDREAPERVDARLVEVVEPADARRDPLCDRDDVCHGCQLRHTTVVEEMRFKRRRVREALERHAGWPADEQPEVESIGPFPLRRGDAHRMRTRLAYRETGEGDAEVGLATPVRDGPVAMSDCPALTGAARRLVGYLESTLDELADPPPAFESGEEEAAAARPGIRRVAVVSPTYGRGLIDLQVEGLASDVTLVEFLHCDRVECFVDELVERLPADVGLSVVSGEMREHLEPPERVRLPLAGMRLVAGCGDWLPATLEPTEALYEHLLERLALGEDDRCLDVGCGIGTLTLLAAERTEAAVGVDNNRRSIEAAELNAVEHGIDNVEFVPSGWEKALRQLALAGRNFSVATLNPTRSPIGARALAYLGQLGIERAMYLGPAVEAAARDLGVLREQGWMVDHLAAANLDPASAQVMLVAEVRR